MYVTYTSNVLEQNLFPQIMYLTDFTPQNPSSSQKKLKLMCSLKHSSKMMLPANFHFCYFFLNYQLFSYFHSVPPHTPRTGSSLKANSLQGVDGKGADMATARPPACTTPTRDGPWWWGGPPIQGRLGVKTHSEYNTHESLRQFSRCTETMAPGQDMCEKS